jgi:AraC-like DNA-binding protein
MMNTKMYLYKRIVDAKLFIDNHFAEDLDLEQISNQAHFSKFHFIRLFKKAFGLSPCQYLISVRLQQAKQLFLKDKSVAEVCIAVGFQSTPSFCTLFKRRYGYSPREFVKHRKKIHQDVINKPLAFVPSCFALKYS